MNKAPTLFISHGAPTFALEPGKAGALLQAAGQRLSGITSVLVVSPHWTTAELRVMAAPTPATIHDFSGFDPRLDDIRYPAPGDPAMAGVVANALTQQGMPARVDVARGRDHGAWVPMLHLLPLAETPVFQLSMPGHLTPQGAFELGRALRPLSDLGVLIVGSGSITHNLSEFSLSATDEAPYARSFTEWVRSQVLRSDFESLINTQNQAPQATRAHPTDEHYLPLLIAAGAASDAATVEVLEGGITNGVIGMESYIWHPS